MKVNILRFHTSLSVSLDTTTRINQIIMCISAATIAQEVASNASTASQCSSITKRGKGHQCLRDAKEGHEFCGIHIRVAASKCQGHKRGGKQCTRRAQKGKDFCGLHINKQARKAKVQCGATTKRGKKCSRSHLEGSDYCKIHADFIPKPKCVAHTKNGKGPQCSRNAKDGSDYCGTHVHTQVTPEVETATTLEGDILDVDETLEMDTELINSESDTESDTE